MVAKGQANAELVQKRNKTQHLLFGFLFSDVDQNEVLNKICKFQVAMSHSSTTNLFQHLKQHQQQYDKCIMAAKTNVRMGRIAQIFCGSGWDRSEFFWIQVGAGLQTTYISAGIFFFCIFFFFLYLTVMKVITKLWYILW